MSSFYSVPFPSYIHSLWGWSIVNLSPSAICSTGRELNSSLAMFWPLVAQTCQFWIVSAVFDLEDLWFHSPMRSLFGYLLPQCPGPFAECECMSPWSSLCTCPCYWDCWYGCREFRDERELWSWASIVFQTRIHKALLGLPGMWWHQKLETSMLQAVGLLRYVFLSFVAKGSLQTLSPSIGFGSLRCFLSRLRHIENLHLGLWWLPSAFKCVHEAIPLTVQHACCYLWQYWSILVGYWVALPARARPQWLGGWGVGSALPTPSHHWHIVQWFNSSDHWSCQCRWIYRCCLPPPRTFSGCR